jgi:TonB C terminal
MSLYGEHPTKRGLSVTMGLIATALLHGGIIGVVWFGRARAEAEKKPAFMDGQVVDVQAVKFGKKRDLSFLPHKEMVIHDKGPKPKIALTENDHALPHMKDPNDKPPEEEDPLKRTHRFDNVNDQPEQKGVEEEGDPNGVKGGTATVGKGPVYLQHLQAAVQNAWVVPTTITDEQLARLEAQACVKIDRNTSKIGEIGMHKTSKDDRFDATLLDALGKVKDSFAEPLTDDVKKLLSDDGTICMRFTFQKSR